MLHGSLLGLSLLWCFASATASYFRIDAVMRLILTKPLKQSKQVLSSWIVKLDTSSLHCPQLIRSIFNILKNYTQLDLKIPDGSVLWLYPFWPFFPVLFSLPFFLWNPSPQTPQTQKTILVLDGIGSLWLPWISRSLNGFKPNLQHIFIDFHTFSYIFIDFHTFSYIFRNQHVPDFYIKNHETTPGNFPKLRLRGARCAAGGPSVAKWCHGAWANAEGSWTSTTWRRWRRRPFSHKGMPWWSQPNGVYIYIWYIYMYMYIYICI